MSFNYDNMEERKTIFTTASESEVTSTTTSTFGSADNGNHSQSINVAESQFSPLATPFQSRNCSDFIGVERHDPTAREAEISAPSTSRVDYGILNDIPLMTNNRDLQDQMGRARADLQVDGDQFSNNMGGSRSNAESVAGVNLFSAESGSVEASAQNAIDMELIVKCMSSANYYVSMLTREQLGVLRSIRPALLYEFLLEIAKVRSEKQQLRRALPNECAFCKNNGENEEYYLSHVLKDWRGRVLCPVLRAFRCPRCGATGDRAHTIKYCPHRPDAGFERAGFLPRRHAQSPPPSVNLGAAADIRRMGVMSPNVNENETTSLGSPELNQHNWWSNYGL